MFRLLAIASIATCLVAPASAQSSPAPKPRSAPPQASVNQQTAPTLRARASCDLGVIAAVGDEFQIKQISLSHWISEPSYVPISHWGLDDLVFERVRAAAGPRTIVQRIPYSKERFPPPKETQNALFRDREAELVEILRKITSGTSCQRFVLVGRSISRFNGSVQTVRGIGIIDLDNPLRHRTYLYALSYIRVFDGRDFAILKQGSAITEREPLLDRMVLGETISGPFREVDNAAFPSNPADAAHNLAFREAVRAMLKSSLDRTLPSMLQPSTTEASSR
jgi:hypothetical protein